MSLLLLRKIGGIEAARSLKDGTSGHGRRLLWTYVCHAFNVVDKQRLEVVGPDRLCAEWILKNGGGVRFTEEPHILHIHYNFLPPESKKLTVSEIDGKNSTIMAIGFDHLKNCHKVRKMVIDNCKYVDDEGLDKLGFINGSLKELTVSNCKNVSEVGLLQLKVLSSLEKLTLRMQLVKNIEATAAALGKALPNCEIVLVK